MRFQNYYYVLGYFIVVYAIQNNNYLNDIWNCNDIFFPFIKSFVLSFLIFCHLQLLKIHNNLYVNYKSNCLKSKTIKISFVSLWFP